MPAGASSRPLRRSGVGFVVIGAGLLGLGTAWHLLRRARDVLALERARVRSCRLWIPGTWPDLPPGLRRPAVCRDGQAGPAAPAGTGGRHRRRRSSALAGGQESRSLAVVGSVGRQRGWRVAGVGRRVAGGWPVAVLWRAGDAATVWPVAVLWRAGDAATVWPVAVLWRACDADNRVAGRRSENVHASRQVPARSERSGAKQARMGPFMSRLRGAPTDRREVWTETDRRLLA